MFNTRISRKPGSNSASYHVDSEVLDPILSAPLMKRRAHHIGITVSDIEAGIDFFRLLLQLEPELRIHRKDTPFLDEIVGYPDVEQKIAFFTVPDDFIVELIEYVNPAPSRVDMETSVIGSSHLCIEVDDIETEFARLRDAGVPFRATRPVATPDGDLAGQKWAYLRSPDGITVELVQTTPS
jgi:catechol 2,3-dioxygenase-like lactoylglutathione lyase family enzyme